MKEPVLADDPVGNTLGPTSINPRMPPPGERRREEGTRRRRRSTRTLRRDPEETRRDLQAEIDHGNAPDRVAICYPGDDGGVERCVTRTIRRWELQQWLARLEGLQGLVVDTER